MDVKAKKLRREGYVTGNLFGREIEGSLPIQMTKKAVDQLLKTDNKGSQIMLEVDGKTYDALIKEVDYNAMANRVDEIDFQALVRRFIMRHPGIMRPRRCRRHTRSLFTNIMFFVIPAEQM